MRSYVCAALALAVTGVALAGPGIPTVIYSDIASSSTSDVPGLAGAKFDAFDRMYRSPDGLLWIMSADTNLATTMDEVIIVGSIPGLSGTTVVQEGVTVLAGTDTAGLIDRNMSINNAGQYAFSTNHNGLTTEDEVVVKWDGASFSYAGQESKELPSPFATEFYGLGLDAASIWADGSVSFRAPSTTGTAITEQDDFLIAGGAVLAQEGVTVPGNQAGGTTRAWDLFNFEDFYSNSASEYLVLGDLEGDTLTDQVLVHNGNVVLQEGSPIAGGPADNIDAAGIVELYMSSNGGWMSRGNFDVTEQDFLVMNGAVLALTDDAVPGGLVGETFSDNIFADCFFSMVSNNNGDFVFGATTSNADPLADAVLVYNNLYVIARQGDPVDVDGNGLFDDNAFINVFNNDDAFLTDSGDYWFTADLMDGAGVGIGQALIHMQVPAPGAIALLAMGGLLGRRRRR